MTSNKQQYVVCVAVDKDSLTGVTLVKNKGPAHLIGRITFPGGKLEQGESVLECASREMAEETGVEEPPLKWESMATIEYADRIVHIVGTLTPKVFMAKTMELEAVHKVSLRHHVRYAKSQPAQYAADFVDICNLVIEHYRLPHQGQFL